MRGWLFILMLISCATTQPTTNPCPTCPTCPSCPPQKPPVIIHDTVTVSTNVHDTIYSAKDTALKQVVVYPVSGDNTSLIQNAIYFQLSTPGVEVYLAPGTFQITQTLVFANIVNGVYKQCTPRFRGCMNAKGAPDGMVSRIIALFGDGPVIALQLGKGGYIQDIRTVQNYAPPTNQIQIDTLSGEAWDDPNIRSNTSSPQCGIAVDPFSDPTYYDGTLYQMYPRLLAYYLPHMSRSGSTAVTFKGVSIKNSYVGFIITPSNQQNGEIINLEHSEVEACKTAYAICQAQSKQCDLIDFKCWGPAFTVIDNLTYGFKHGDGAGSPMTDMVNLAGFIHQVLWVSNYAFQGSFNNIYGEGVFKLGRLGGDAGAKLSNSTIDFTNSNYGQPTPDYYFYSQNTVYDNCTFRLYAGAVPGMRIFLNGDNYTFIGGEQTMPPLWHGIGGKGWPPKMIGVALLLSNTIINSNNYDTLTWSTVTDVHINKSDWSGWFTKGSGLDQRGNFSNIKIGDPVVTDRNLIDIYEHSYNYPIGYVHHVSRDTVFITNTGQGIQDGEHIAVYDFGLKN